MRFCQYEFCDNELTREQKAFCSRACCGFAARGSGKCHVRIRLESGKRVYLHRYVFEQHYRPLGNGEVVHHIDGDRFNNEPENLEALTYAEHLAAHNFWRGHRRQAATYSVTAEKQIEEFATYGF